MNLALHMQGVAKRYGNAVALERFSLDVPAGSIFGLVGSNGAGKTTALTAAVGLLRLQAGVIDVLQQGPFDPRLHRGRVTLLPQDAALPGHATVTEVLLFYGQLQGLSHLQILSEMDRLLSRFDLSDRRHATIRTLSHGMRRRLGIVQAFLGSPELVLLDEPLNGLDPKETVNARSYFQECRGRQTLVISSHLLSELEAVCDAVAFVEQGKTLRQGGLQEILREDRLLTYALDSFPLPLPALASAAPMVQMETVEERKELTVRFASSETSAQAVNASLVPILLAQGIGILEIRRGSSLEREYLQSHPMSDRNARNTDAREAPVG